MCSQAREENSLMARLDNYKTIVRKWLRDNEELDYSSSRYFDGYFVLRVKENGEFKLILRRNMRKGRLIFAKETAKGIRYLYDSIQLYRDWYPDSKDFSKLSAIDINIYLHLIISLLDDMTAIIGVVMMGVDDYVHDIVCKYLTLNTEAKGENARAVMQRCANLFLYPHFCYTTFYFGYRQMNMVQEAGIAHEMMGKTSDLKLGKNKTKLEENRIAIAFGLMLQGKFEEAISIFSKQYDLCIKKFNEEKGKKSRLAYSLTTPYSDILIAEGYLFWATGMVFWTKEKRRDAEKYFRDSYDALSRAYSTHKNEPMPFLVEHLLTELRKGRKVVGMDEQLRFMKEWSENRRKEIEAGEEAKTEKQPGLTKEMQEKISFIEGNISKFLSDVGKKEKAKVKGEGPEEEKAEYIVFLSRPSGIGSFIDKDTNTENHVHERYARKKQNYDIFIYNQAVYKKVMDEGKAKMISLNPSMSFRGLLILFLKYKDMALPYVKLYHKAFSWKAVSGETNVYHDKNAKLPEDVMNTLKNAVNELKREFDYIKGFDIPRAKNSTYKCEGNFKFCLILKKSANERYNMLFEKSKNHSIP